MCAKSEVPTIRTPPDGTQPYGLTIPVHVVTAAEIADMEARHEADDRKPEARNARRTAFARKVGLMPRRRHPLRTTRPVRTARPRGARPRPRARRTSSSSTSSGADPGGDEPPLGDPPPRRRPLEARYPWRVWLWERSRALDALDGAPDHQLSLDTEGTS